MSRNSMFNPGRGTGGGSGGSTTVIDDLITDSGTSALSARQGKILNDKITSHEALKVFDDEVHGLKFNKVTGNLEYLNTDTNTWVEIKGGSSTIDIVDDLTTGGSDKALSAEQGKILNTNAEAHKSKIASTTELGHVMVDGTTITITPEGVISAIGGASGNGGYKQQLLPTTTIGQNIWIIPFNDYVYPNDLLIVSYNTTLLADNQYAISHNGTNWEVKINDIPSDQPIQYNEVFVIMVKLGGGNRTVQKTIKLPLTTASTGQNKWEIPLNSFDSVNDEILPIYNTTALMTDMYAITFNNGKYYIEINDIPSNQPIDYNQLLLYIFQNTLSNGVDEISGELLIDGTIQEKKLSQEIIDKLNSSSDAQWEKF